MYFYGNCIIGALHSEFKLVRLLPPRRSAMAACSANAEPSQESESPEKSPALTFTVDFDDKPQKNMRRMPRQLSSSKTKSKKKVSEVTIAEKQKQAEERRKKHIEDKLERIHQLEEEAQKMAQAMAPMLTHPNGAPNGDAVVRKLHKDTDTVSAVMTEEVNFATQIPESNAEHIESEAK